MSAESSGLFTVKEINRIKTLQDVIDRRITPGRAAEQLGITPRHCSRLLKRYRDHGPLGINNRSRGNPGNRLLPKEFTDHALEIIRKNYSDFGPTLVREKLEETHGLVLGKETVRRLMIKAGLWVPRKMRAPKIQQPRYRRACVGNEVVGADVELCRSSGYTETHFDGLHVYYNPYATVPLDKDVFFPPEITQNFYDITNDSPVQNHPDRALVSRQLFEPSRASLRYIVKHWFPECFGDL